MVKEFEFYHGLVFTGILHLIPGGVFIKSFPTTDNASYILNERIGIYIKYSTKRLSPWSFSFNKRHLEEIKELKKRFNFVYVLLVCRDDGIVVLNSKELEVVLNNPDKDNKWISIYRNRRKMYSVEGSDGKLTYKIGINEFPFKIFNQNNKT